jgi:hypothetical protein
MPDSIPFGCSSSLSRWIYQDSGLSATALACAIGDRYIRLYSSVDEPQMKTDSIIAIKTIPLVAGYMIFLNGSDYRWVPLSSANTN